MKPKLIVINGPLGSGKSTLANKYADNHPITLCLDIDNIWTMLSNWREEKDLTGQLAKDMATEMGRIILKARHDVVIPQILQTVEIGNRFRSLASECDADYIEVLLDLDKEDAVQRFKTRNIRSGHVSGFREGGIVATGGREQKLTKMHEAMTEAARNRKDIIKIYPVFDDIEATYGSLIAAISQTK